MSTRPQTHRRPVTLLLTLLLALALAAASLVPTSAEAAVADTSVTYTSDEDFAEGQRVNLDIIDGTLRLREIVSTFPSIWIALSNRGTIARVDTLTGEIIGEYLTAPDGTGRNPSRTTVGFDGTAWAGNRSSGYVVHVGVSDVNQCIDRDGDGEITTSSGYGDVLPWPAPEAGEGPLTSVPEDECILHLVKPKGGDARHVSVDPDGDVWVASVFGSPSGENRIYTRIDGTTAEILDEAGPFECGGYGGLVDSDGVIWSASSSSQLLRWDPAVEDSDTCINVGGTGYGLALAPDGHIWLTLYGTNQVKRITPDGLTQDTFTHAAASAQGLAVAPDGDVWVSSSLTCSSNCVVSRLKGDGTFVGAVPTPTGAGSTGIAVDSEGKVWAAAINSSTAVRIDPTAGDIGADGETPIGEVDLTVEFPATEGRPAANPYNYSDMTGGVLLGSTAPQGSWTVVQDSGTAGTTWGSISWNDEPEGFVPEGAVLDGSVEVRTADTPAGLGGQPFVAVDKCEGLDELTGRYLQARITMRPNAAGESPVLSDVTIRSAAERDRLGCAGEGGPPQCENFPDVPPTNVHAADICALAADGILRGFRDGLYRPGLSISRGQAASVVARTAGLAPVTPRPPTFSDILGDTHQGDIEALAAEGIVLGYRDGTFRPGDALPRDEAASMLARWLELAEVANGPFTDVPAGSAHRGNINALYEEGIVRGTTSTTFSPSVDVRRDQFAALVNRSR
jgi:streptogramin lyase